MQLSLEKGSLMEIYKALQIIQSELKVPKSQYNSFGKYNYRSCEDIVESLKPLLSKTNTTLIINDKITMVGERYYVLAEAELISVDDGSSVKSVAYAREDEQKSGMSLSQVTGATSSYARKYALNGLLCIDDTKDADTMNNSNKTSPQPTCYDWKTLKARAVQGGISEDDLIKYLKGTLKVDGTDSMTPEHYKKAFDWVNAQRYAKR